MPQHPVRGSIFKPNVGGDIANMLKNLFQPSAETIGQINLQDLLADRQQKRNMETEIIKALIQTNDPSALLRAEATAGGGDLFPRGPVPARGTSGPLERTNVPGSTTGKPFLPADQSKLVPASAVVPLLNYLGTDSGFEIKPSYSKDEFTAIQKAYSKQIETTTAKENRKLQAELGTGNLRLRVRETAQEAEVNEAEKLFGEKVRFGGLSALTADERFLLRSHMMVYEANLRDIIRPTLERLDDTPSPHRDRTKPPTRRTPPPKTTPGELSADALEAISIISRSNLTSAEKARRIKKIQEEEKKGGK